MKNKHIYKIQRWWMKLRLQPIRVFCFHQVSETFDPDIYCKQDWISIRDFKAQIEKFQSEGYRFITLAQAYDHIKCDIFRFKKYAVLTADDGLKCHAEIIPWLDEQHIPVVLFVNAETIFNQTCNQPMKEHFQIINDEDDRKHAEKLFMQIEDLMAINSPVLSIGLHGLDHKDVRLYSLNDFRKSVDICVRDICSHIDIIPYYAYTYGKHTIDTDRVLWNMNYVPVLTDGAMNYNDPKYIHRELLFN